MPKGEHRKGKKPTNTPKGASDRATVNIRISIVVKMLIQGYKSFQIISYGEAEWKLSPSQIQEYIRKANELISAETYEDIEREKKKGLLVCDEVIQKGFSENNMGTVLSSQSLKNKILGLEAPKKIDLSGKINVDDIIQRGAESIRAKFLNQAKDTKRGRG